MPRPRAHEEALVFSDLAERVAAGRLRVAGGCARGSTGTYSYADDHPDAYLHARANDNSYGDGNTKPHGHLHARADGHADTCAHG